MFRILIAVALLLVAASPAFSHGISAADIQAMLEGGYPQYVWLGATHMLTGYDHLLFIFGVVFFLTGFRDIVRFITAFTLGHSITLIFATLFGITADYYLVDAVIALSVCYKGFDNLRGFQNVLDCEPPDLLRMIFAFGLVHGFGLSTRLQQLPLGDDQLGLFFRIISFNLGVEVGQVIALLVMVTIIAGWRHTRSFNRFSLVANGGLVAAGILLFVFQLHGFLHHQFPDGFGFSHDYHHHAHEAMELKKAKSEIGDNLLDTE